MDTTTMRTWAEIDLDNLAHNYHILRKQIPAGCRFLGLCKANAYGHGAEVIGKKLEELGADMLAVACLEEGMELRRAGVTIPILCLGQTDPSYAADLVKYNITASVSDWETGWALSKYGQGADVTLKIHIKVDTGMTRLGFLWEAGREDEVADQIAALCRLPNLEPEGMFTHYADADGNESYTMEQYTSFLEAKGYLSRRGIKFPIYHTANSGATLYYPVTHMNMVRPGLVLYGYYPDENSAERHGHRLKPVMKLRSRILSVREIPKGTAVSYGCTAVLQRNSRLAILPIGYGDGYFRSLSDRMVVDFAGVRCPIVGRICMDMCMVDVTDHPEIGVGSVATVYGEEGLLELAAQLAGTIPYELLCDVNPRVPRVYHHSGEPVIE